MIHRRQVADDGEDNVDDGRVGPEDKGSGSEGELFGPSTTLGDGEIVDAWYGV